MRIEYLVPLFIFILFSCQKNDFGPECPDGSICSDLNLISFENPQTGQLSKYVLLEGQNYAHPDSFGFSYLADTLIIEITEENQFGFKVQEHLTPGSASLNGGDNLPFPDSTFSYYFNIANDTVFFHHPHRIYFQNFSTLWPDIRLPLEWFDQQAEIKGWKTSLGYCECYQTAYTEDYELLGITFNKLNILIENTPMQVDGNGTTVVFSRQDGIVRVSNYSWWTQSGIGWDLLPF